MRKLLRCLLALVALGVLAVSAAKLTAYLSQGWSAARVQQTILEQAVRQAETAAPPPAPDAQAEPDPPLEPAPITVDFAALKKNNSDVAGWLYCQDTPIDLPIVACADNETYLHHIFDGTPNNTGTLFVDCRNAGDFSDAITVVYGHNMKNGTMFGTLTRYKNQDYYDAHPVLWLLTPGGNFQILPVAGCVVPADSAFYAIGHTGKAACALVRQAMADSTFAAPEEIAEGDRFLVLSTCSYEFENARFLLIGRMVRAAP